MRVSMAFVAFSLPAILAYSTDSVQASSLSVTGAAAATGNFGLRAEVGSTEAYVQDDSPNGERRYHVQFNVDLSATTDGRFDVFRCMGGGDDVALAMETTGVDLRVRTRLDNGTYLTIQAVRPPGWLTLELDWQAAVLGMSDGSLEWKINGVTAGALDSLDNDTGAIDFVRLGVLSPQPASTGAFDLDDFISTRTPAPFAGDKVTDPPPGDILFQDGFESGDTSAWSATFPPPVSVEQSAWGAVKALYAGSR